MTESVAFDPGIGDYVTNLYNEAYIIENDLIQIPQFPRKSRYYNIACKNIYKAILNNYSFYKGCLAWAYYIINNNANADISANPFLAYTEEQKAQYSPTETVDFFIEYLDKFISDIKYYHVKNINLPEDIKEFLVIYREFVAMNEGFINISRTSDLKLPENYKQDKSLEDIKQIIDDAISSGDLSNLSVL